MRPLRHYPLLFCLLMLISSARAAEPFSSDSIQKYAKLTDDYIRIVKHPDYWNNTVVGGKSRPSNIWTRGVFYEGHMAYYQIHPDTALFNYAYNWGKSFTWLVAYGKATSTSADDQCCGQTYLELYKLKPSADMVTGIKACLDNSKATKVYTYWWWVDALQMAMPAYALLGSITKDTSYYDFMYKSYSNTRNIADGTGLFNLKDGLWWRDLNFNTPYVNANGKNVYWSRGNGWAYAALVRVLTFLPKTETHYQEYLSDYLRMSSALLACQRNDGFWNANLADTLLYAGKETSGTALFVYGLAWGLNNNLLSRATYLNGVKKGWLGIQRYAIHPDNGFLGWMQGTGDDPSDGQPLSYTQVPNFEDYGAGCVLLGAAESWKLSRTLEKEDSIAINLGRTVVNTILLEYTSPVLHIKTTTTATLGIYRLNGQKMLEKVVSAETSVDLSGWPRGLYLVRTRAADGCKTLKIMR
jgi:unsaturated rhamnogalacturonyl hydrolase